MVYRYGKVTSIIGDRERKLRGSGLKDSLYQNSVLTNDSTAYSPGKKYRCATISQFEGDMSKQTLNSTVIAH